MTARTGLADIITQVRGLVNAGTADYAIGTANYWDGDHIQEVLDRHRVDVSHELLEPRLKYLAGGSVEWREYRSQYRNFEQTTGGTAIFELDDATGANVGTADYSVDYQRGIVTFGSTTGGSAYYVTGRSYDIYGAAADIWRMKAAHAADGFDFSTDNHSVSRSQKFKQYMAMADQYEAMAGGGEDNTTLLVRSDVIS